MATTAATRGRTVPSFREEVVFCDVPEGSDTILPPDFLAFGVGAPRVGDGNLIDARVAFREARDDFRLEAEAIGGEMERARDLPADRLVARLHVGEVEVREDVAHRRQNLVAD